VKESVLEPEAALRLEMGNCVIAGRFIGIRIMNQKSDFQLWLEKEAFGLVEKKGRTMPCV
jgi:hypothetical protein